MAFSRGITRTMAAAKRDLETALAVHIERGERFVFQTRKDYSPGTVNNAITWDGLRVGRSFVVLRETDRAAFERRCICSPAVDPEDVDFVTPPDFEGARYYEVKLA